MDRRDFLRKGIGGGIIAGAALALGQPLGRWGRVLAAPSAPRALPFDMVAVKGGEPDVMFDKAIDSLGGIKAFVARGQKVLLKPNIGWDVPPENGGNTHPRLVARIIEQCRNAGAKEVYVFDHTCDNAARCYSTSGIERAVKEAGGKIVSGESESYYQQVSIPRGKRLTSAKVHELLLDADVVINVPVLKHHSSSRITVGMKNWMGVVWDRGFWHRNDLHQCIADFATYRAPALTVVDAYYVMKRNGPRGTSREDVLTMKSQILCTDPLAADIAAVKLFGMSPSDIPHLVYAEQLGVGRANLDALSINRIKL